jgi:hypothetical protein
MIQETKKMIDILTKELENRIKGIKGEGTIEQLEKYFLPLYKKIFDLFLGKIEMDKELKFYSFAQDIIKVFEYGYDPIINKSIPVWDINNPSDMHKKLLEYNTKYVYVMKNWEEWNKENPIVE